MNMMSIIDNSIRSLFQMIAVIYDAEGEYTVVDHNRELENIMAGSSDRGEPGPFDELRHDLIKNIHPEDSTEGNDCILLIRDINERKANELKRETEEREVLMEIRDQYDALFEENMTDRA